MGFFDNANNISINNKEVESIKITTNNAIIYDMGDKLDLSSDKNSISYTNSETATITATLTNKNIPVPNKLISFDVGNTSSITINNSHGSSISVSSNVFKIDLHPASTACRITWYGNPSTLYTLQATYNDGVGWTLVHPPSHTTIYLGSNIIYVNGNTLYYIDTNNEVGTYDVSDYNMTSLYLNNVNGTVITTNIFSEITNSNGIATITYTPTSTGSATITAQYNTISKSIQLQIT